MNKLSTQYIIAIIVLITTVTGFGQEGFDTVYVHEGQKISFFNTDFSFSISSKETQKTEIRESSEFRGGISLTPGEYLLEKGHAMQTDHEHADGIYLIVLKDYVSIHSKSITVFPKLKVASEYSQHLFTFDIRLNGMNYQNVSDLKLFLSGTYLESVIDKIDILPTEDPQIITVNALVSLKIDQSSYISMDLIHRNLLNDTFYFLEPVR